MHQGQQETIANRYRATGETNICLRCGSRGKATSTYQEQILGCDEEIEKLVRAFPPRVDPEQRPLPPNRKRQRKGRKERNVNPKTGFDVRTESYKLFGVDWTQIPGLLAMVLGLFSEVGRDMSRWPTAAQFVSWLALCPDNDISGGRVLWREVRRVKNRAGQMFRWAAHSLHHEESELGDYLRRMKAKHGPEAATTATAHKIAIIFYTMVKKQVEYDATLWTQRNMEREKRFEAKLRRQADRRGYRLVPMDENAAAYTTDAAGLDLEREFLKSRLRARLPRPTSEFSNALH